MGRKLNIIDNSGATEAKLIRIIRKRKEGSKELKIGQLIVIRLTKNIPNSKLRKGEVHKGIVVTGLEIKGKRSIILVKDNSKEYIPIGSRVKGLIGSKIRNNRGCGRLISLAKRTL
jgi:large subunit ribosomal protein L14